MKRLSHAWYAAVLVLMATLANVSIAEEIQLGVAPTNPTQAGFSMFVMTERLGNEGFQPITLRFRATATTFTRQRQLRILFRPRTQYATEIDYQFGIDVTVPQDVASHDVRVMVPHFYRWETCSVQVIEDGRRLGKLPSKLVIPVAVNDWGQNMSIGILSPRDALKSDAPWAKFPDLRSIVTVLGDGPIDEQAKVKRLSSKEARKFAEELRSSWTRFRIIDEDALQTSWIGYSQLDLILAPYPVLERIEKEQPEQSAALQQWVSAGGQLWTYAAPKRASTPSVSPDPLMPDQTVGAESTGAPSWLRGAPAEVTEEIQYSGNPSASMSLRETNDTSPIQYQPWNYGSYYSNSSAYGSSQKKRQLVYDDLVAAKNPMVQTVPLKQLAAGLGAMRYGFGRVIMIEQQDPFPGSFQLWTSLEMKRQTWSERNGVDYSAGNDSYWAWLMSTVGQPPVTMFVILNGLFVLIMGPVLYFGLRRRSRLYLLYFLAPALAFLATLGLFMYAFLSDGFDNRVRLRQLTWIDGRHPVATGGDGSQDRFPVVDQSRQTYYTVVDNQRGLRFDGDAFVLPVHHAALMNNYNYYPADDGRPGDYLINQVGSDRIYAGDFLPTRTQVHYLVTRPRVDVCPLEIRFEADGVSLTNRLATPLRRVGVCDANGKYWIATDVAPGAMVMLDKAQTNVIAGIAIGAVDPDASQMPTPYQNRVSMTDRTAIEERMLEFSRQPPPRSFLAQTEVEPAQCALRECIQDDCVRLVGGLLP